MKCYHRRRSHTYKLTVVPSVSHLHISIWYLEICLLSVWNENKLTFKIIHTTKLLFIKVKWALKTRVQRGHYLRHTPWAIKHTFRCRAVSFKKVNNGDKNNNKQSDNEVKACFIMLRAPSPRSWHFSALIPNSAHTNCFTMRGATCTALHMHSPIATAPSSE